MKPSVKLNSIAFGLATLMVFTIWSLLLRIADIHPYFAAAISAVISLGVYRLIATFIVDLSKKITPLKKFLLGNHYLEGTWVGYYLGKSGEERYIIERFEQEVDNLVIRGRAYDHNANLHTTWTANPVNIDSVLGQLSYMYKCEPIKGKDDHNGVAVFNFDRKDQYSAPHGLTGYSADVQNGERISARETKISTDASISDVDALKEAQRYFQELKGK